MRRARRMRSLPSNDEIFAAAIRRSNVWCWANLCPTAAPTTFGGRGLAATASLPPKAPRTRAPFWSLSRVSCAIFRSSKKPPPAAASLPRPIERDGIVRRAPVVMHAGDAFVPSLALEMLRVATSSNSPVYSLRQERHSGVGFSRFRLPTDRQGRLWIYFNHTDPERYVSAETSCTAASPTDRIRGKLVLVGTSAIGLLGSEDHAARSGDSGRRGARSGHRERVEQCAAFGAELGDRRGDGHRGGLRPCDHHRRTDVAGRDRRRARGAC